MFTHDHICDDSSTFRVKYYIKYVWNNFLVDPDRGLNVQKKLTNAAAQQPGSILYKIFQSLQKPEDALFDQAVGPIT